MELSEKQKKAKNLLTRTLLKAWEDESFKQKLLKSPFNAIENLTGEKLVLRDGVKMIVVDQAEPDTFYFNIPMKPYMDDIELNDEQLELVAGGETDVVEFINWVKSWF